MPSKDPAQEARASDRSPAGTPGPYSVFHVRRNAPEEIHIDRIDAPDQDAARQIAQRLFRDSTILHIRREIDPEEIGESGDYPSARFIRGEFLASAGPDGARAADPGD